MNENEEQATQEIETLAGAEEPGQEESLPEIVSRIRSEYESRIDAITERHIAEIKERDEIIAQLIGGNNQDSDATRIPFVERLNNKRNYKKW